MTYGEYSIKLSYVVTIVFIAEDCLISVIIIPVMNLYDGMLCNSFMHHHTTNLTFDRIIYMTCSARDFLSFDWEIYTIMSVLGSGKR